jgi:hypothetical protein
MDGKFIHIVRETLTEKRALSIRGANLEGSSLIRQKGGELVVENCGRREKPMVFSAKARRHFKLCGFEPNFAYSHETDSNAYYNQVTLITAFIERRKHWGKYVT